MPWDPDDPRPLAEWEQELALAEPPVPHLDIEQPDVIERATPPVPHLEIEEPDVIERAEPVPHLDLAEPDVIERSPAVEPIGAERVMGDAGDVEWPPPEWQPQLAEEERPLIGARPALEVPQLEAPGPIEPTELDPLEEEIARQFGMEPEVQVMDQARREADRQKLIHDRTLDLLEQSREAQEEALRGWQQAQRRAQERMAQIDRQIQQLSQQEIDPNRWWGDRSTGQKIASYAIAMIGGLMAPNRGGVNSGIDFIQGQIDRDIEVQGANLDHQRALLGQQQGIVAEMYRMSGDVFQAQEAARIASMEMAAAQLEAEAQAFDPRGTTAALVVQAVGEMRAASAQARQEMEDRIFDREVELHKRDIAERQMRLQEGQAQLAQMAGAGGPEAPVGRTVTDPDTGEELPIGHPRVVTNPRTGQAWVARNENEAKRLQDRFSRYSRVRDAADQLQALVRTSKAKATSGGRTRFTSQETQDIDAARRRLATEMAGFAREGAPGKGDIEAALARIPEPDVWFGRADADPTLTREIEAMDRVIRGDLRQAGIDPGEFDPAAGEPAAGFEAGIKRQLEPTEHRVLRDGFRNTAIEDLNPDDAMPFAEPPVGSDPETAAQTLEANLGAVAERIDEARTKRDEAQASGDHESARKLNEVYMGLLRAREQIRMRASRASDDARRQRRRHDVRQFGGHQWGRGL